MKKAKIFFSASIISLALCALTFRPVHIPENEDELLATKGEVVSVTEGTSNDIVFKLKGETDSFYINRGLEQGLNLKDLQSKLIGKQVTLKYPKHWSLLNIAGNTKHLSVIELNNEKVFSSLN